MVWVDSGRPTRAVIEYMDKIRSMVPHFEQVLGDQPNWIVNHGYPTDILPVEATALGRSIGVSSHIPLSFVGDCCLANLWQPMDDFIKQSKFTGVIRGQKLVDSLKTKLQNGDIHEGIEYCLPVEKWTDQEVFDYLGPEHTPAPYAEGLESSIDCENCTAYSSHRKGLQAYLDKHSPFAAREVRMVRKEIARLARHHIQLLEEDS